MANERVRLVRFTVIVAALFAVLVAYGVRYETHSRPLTAPDGPCVYLHHPDACK